MHHTLLFGKEKHKDGKVEKIWEIESDSDPLFFSNSIYLFWFQKVPCLGKRKSAQIRFCKRKIFSVSKKSFKASFLFLEVHRDVFINQVIQFSGSRRNNFVKGGFLEMFHQELIQQRSILCKKQMQRGMLKWSTLPQRFFHTKHARQTTLKNLRGHQISEEFGQNSLIRFHLSSHSNSWIKIIKLNKIFLNRSFFLRWSLCWTSFGWSYFGDIRELLRWKLISKTDQKILFSKTLCVSPKKLSLNSKILPVA